MVADRGVRTPRRQQCRRRGDHDVPGDQPPTDAELIAMVRAGDRRAFGPLYERHRAAALRVARLYARDAAAADDLAAEAFTRVLAAIGRGKGPDEAFRAYLYTT